MPEFWYEPPTDARQATDQERSAGSHASMLGIAVLVFTLLVAALLLAR